MAGNSDLHAAAKAKKDEFYTRLEDIQLELNNYRPYFKAHPCRGMSCCLILVIR